MPSDEILYKRYIAGDSGAADPLVERYGNPLTLYINNYIQDIHEAEDLMIEAFSLLFAKERPIKGEGAFKAYLFKTARNLAFRHRQKHRLWFLRLEELPFEVHSEASADEELLQDERNRQLYRAMEQINQEYREAVYLVYFEGLSYRNTALVMGKNEQQVTNLVYRGKQSLKKILEKEGFVYEDN